MALTQSQIDKILKGIHSGDIDIENLPDKLSAFTYDELIQFVERGFGKLDSALKVGKMELYQGNVSAFSGAKTFQEVKDISQFVFNPDGSKRKFKEFREFAQPITEQYNKVWLKTEQDTAFGVAQGADEWIDIEKDKDLFPMLQYQTAGDERVRADHAAWDGIIKPVDSSFWSTRMPPNDWGCRCSVIKLTEGEPTNLNKHLKEYNKNNPDAKVKSLKNPSQQFNENPGKVNHIYDPEKHPYFKHTKAEDPAFKRAITWQSRE
jgi:SPP1 gp7 family putative phage head morphogenesis protein